MKIRLLSAIVLSLALGAVAWAQDANPSGQDSGQDSGQNSGQNSGMAPGGGYGQRGDRGFGRGATMGSGRNVTGSVTAVAADHYTVKTFEGQTYTVNFSSNTRIFKQRAAMRRGDGMNGGGAGMGAGQGMGGGQGMGQGMGQGRGYMRSDPPQPIKSTDIKVDDAITAMGKLDASAKSIGATSIVLIDPQRAKEMEQMEANFGKTWLTGRVTAIDGVTVTLMGPDNTAHTFVANENTDFRERRNPIALTDVKVGDIVRVDGSIQNGAFAAASVNVMSRPGATPRLPRNAPPQ